MASAANDNRQLTMTGMNPLSARDLRNCIGLMSVNSTLPIITSNIPASEPMIMAFRRWNIFFM